VRYPLTPNRMATIKKIDNNSTHEDVEKLEPSHVASENAKRCSQLGKQLGSLSKT